jgi:hypothetical protein
VTTDSDAPLAGETGTASRQFLERAARAAWKNLEEAVTGGFDMRGGHLDGQYFLQALANRDAELVNWTRERNREAKKFRNAPRLRS